MLWGFLRYLCIHLSFHFMNYCLQWARLIQITFPKPLLLKGITVVNPLLWPTVWEWPQSQVCLLCCLHLRGSNTGSSWSHRLLTRRSSITLEIGMQTRQLKRSSLLWDCCVKFDRNDLWPRLQRKLECHWKGEWSVWEGFWNPVIYSSSAVRSKAFKLLHIHHSAGCKLLSAAVGKW